MVVISKQGGGRAGCFCAVAIAYEFMKAQDTPQPFDNDSNLLNSVVRGVRTQRAGLVSNLRQFQFCHHMLGEALWGTASEQTDGGDASGKTSKNKGRVTILWPMRIVQQVDIVSLLISSSVPGLLEVSLTLHSAADQQADNVHLLYYPHWPENGNHCYYV